MLKPNYQQEKVLDALVGKKLVWLLEKVFEKD